MREVYTPKTIGTVKTMVENNLKKIGYEHSSHSTDQKNELRVSGTTYSTQTGQGTAMGNKFITYETNTFTNDNGDKISYT